MSATTPLTGRCDLMIRGGEVIDGSGRPRFRADVAVTGDRIVAVGDLGAVSADREVDAAGLAVAPGFIDVHTHDDRYLLTHPDVAPKASQGVTTVVVGNCGFSLAPCVRLDPNQFPFNLWLDRPEFQFRTVGDFFEQLERTPPALNAAVLVGHSTLRYGTMEALDRPATDRQIADMQALLREGLEAGAIGMSSGLFYPPARAATTDEVTAVAEVLRPVDGIYTAHIRDEAAHVVEAVEEAAEIGRRAGVQVVISHHKASGAENFGRTVETLKLIDGLRRGQRLTLDVYPYNASSTMLLPDMVARSSRVLVTWSKQRPDVLGRDLDDLAREMACDRMEAAQRLVPAGAVYFQMHEEDVRRVIAYPGSMIGSDGLPDDQHPHPRLWGTFPRVLGHYARDERLMTLEEAVHRMTGLPAAEFGFGDRGAIRPDAAADLVLFDPASVKDAATFETPATPAIGIIEVLVGGRPVWRHGRATGERPGQPIRLADTARGQQSAA